MNNKNEISKKLITAKTMQEFAEVRKSANNAVRKAIEENKKIGIIQQQKELQ